MAPRGGRSREWACAAGIALIAFGVYHRSLSNDFVNLDDGQYVTNNPFIRYPTWEKLGIFFREWQCPSTVAGYYQPLTMASLMLDSAIAWHLPPRPYLFHLSNVLLHCMNAVLVFVWIRRLFRFDENRKAGLALAAGVALLFALHPINVEVVSWVCQRKALLSTTFALGTLIAFTEACRPRGTRAFVAALAGAVCFVLSMLAKPTGTLLFIALAGLAIWPIGRARRGAVLALVYVPIAVGFGYVAYISQKQSMGLAHMTLLDNPALATLIACHNVAFYLYKLAWPAMLSPQYPLPPDAEVHLGNPAFRNGLIVTASVALLLIVMAVALFASIGMGPDAGRARRGRIWPVLVGLIGFLALIAPVLGPVEFMGAIAADRFVYLPMLMLLPMIVGLWPRQRGTQVALAFLGIVALVALGGKTYAQQSAWTNSLAYWEQSLRYEPDNPMLWEGKASAYLELYDRYEREPDGRDHRDLLNNAQSLLEDVIRVRPTYSRAYSTLSAVMILLNDPARALEMAERELGMQGVDIEATISKARALSRLGRYEEAIESYQHYLTRKPFDPEAWEMLGQAYSRLRQHDRAEACYAKVVIIDPEYEHGEPHYGLAQARVMQGREAEAIEPLENAVRRRPADGQYRLALAACLASAGRDAAAMQELALAVRLWPQLYGVAERQPRFARFRETPFWNQLRGLASQPTTSPAGGRANP